MRSSWTRTLVAAAALLLAMQYGALAQAEAVETAAADVTADTATEAAGEPLTEDELEVVVARIALYPDELVALIIAASLYPLEIVQAERFLEKNKGKQDVKPPEDWDGSVISLLNYPDIVKMMSDDLEWTQLLGDLAVNQQKDMLVAIQQLRDQAVATGVLETTEHVSVVEENSNVVIKSADPEVVYVPQYEPQMLYDPGYVATAAPIVYSDPDPSYYYPTAPYFTGLVTGAVFAAAVDWDDWGAWGGDVDVDIKVDGDKVKIDYDKIKGGNNKINIKEGDKINVDRDKLKNVDRSKIEVGNKNIDQTKLKQELKNNDLNRVNNKVAARPVDKGAAAKNIKGQDVRKNVQTGLKDRPTPSPKPAARPSTGAKPAGKPAAKPANRPATVNKKPSGAKPGARPDNRPSKPSAFGDPGKGKPASINSNRGNTSRGGGLSGGRPKSGGISGRRRAAAVVAVAGGGVEPMSYQMNRGIPDMFRHSTSVLLIAAACLVAAFASPPTSAAEDPFDRFVAETEETFDDPAAVVEQFKSRLAAGDKDGVLKLLGLDPTAAAASEGLAERFIEIRDMAAVLLTVQEPAPDRRILLLGREVWPFPFPIVRTDGKWSFDPVAGLDEVINRRIGENELAAIATARAYVAAQELYRTTDWDGDGVPEYAQNLISTPGTYDGLYWPSGGDVPVSPAGPFVEEAVAETGKKLEAGAGYFGYRFRILKGQGDNIAGGRYDYVINGNMIAGFGLIAWPVEYDRTGVKTFVVNQYGTVYEKDLGPDTEALAGKIKRFNPDDSWSVVTDVTD